MNKILTAAAGAALLLGAATSADAKSKVLDAGVYAFALHATTVSQTHGTTCDFMVNNDYEWFIEFPGLGKTGAVAHAWLTTPPAHYILVVDLPKTPTSGNWHGNYSASVQPGNLLTYNGTFTLTLDSGGIPDDHSIAGTMMISGVPGNGSDTCTVTFNAAGIFTGPLK